MSRLQGLGLTENQAKAYLALLHLGQAGASALHKASGVPRNKVYSVVEELNEKGLAEIILDEPTAFRPRGLDGYLGKLMEGLASEQARLARERDVVAREFQAAKVDAKNGNPGSFKLFKGRRSVLEQHKRMGADAKQSVRIIASEYSCSRMLGSGGLPTRDAQGAMPISDMVAYTPLTENNKDDVARIHALFGKALRVATNTPSNLVMMVVDDQQVMFTHFVPDSPSLTAGDDIAIWTDNPVILKLTRGLFQQTQLQSHSYEVARAMLDKNLTPPRFDVVRDPEMLRHIVIHGLGDCEQALLVVPRADMEFALPLVTPEEQQEIAENKRSVRIISDCPPAELAAFAWGSYTEVRHLPVLPARFALFDRQLLRAYDVDEVGGAFFGGAGTIVFATDLPGAAAEAADHFNRMWKDATPIPSSTAGAAAPAATKGKR